MALGKARILRIKFSKDTITFIKSDTSSAPASFREEGIRLELTIGRIFHKALNKTRVEGIFEKNDFEFLGSILYKLLCLFDQQDARNFVYNELSVILRDDTRGIIVLEFEKDAYDLAMLPWEYLQIKRNPDKRIEPFYIGAQKNLKFDLIRYIANDNEIAADYSPKHQNKLIVVKVICNPQKDFLEVDKFEDSFEALGKAFVNDKGDKMIETWRLENPSVKNFIQEMKTLDALIDGDYILHFYGHARMNKEDPEIAFIDNNGQKQWVRSDFFENFFGTNQKYRQPRVVVMQACESGQLNNMGKGLAVSLIKKGIPFVLAMQNEVTPDTSIAFFAKFYHSLLSGKDIFQAVTIGRVFLGCEYRKSNPDIELEHYNNNSFGTPVLFSSTVTPIRFFPEKEDKDQERQNRKLVCQVCGTEYSYDSGREFCIKDRCKGRLEPKKVSKENVRTPEPAMSAASRDQLNPHDRI
ncbi:hypothetical protein OKW21_004276 [Catalinimonas alkaloidigena]|uniref:CHAT domain-containing protein n=1 Tax=Catalinimonas alkaloidigena TaxID=1075417 RepID=UPI0024054AA1|nr:CHAT domain-containing protein [Catalinimonas alkaloidigena]MDF9799013.1 hypothetical protein [Catalinimonas alkaloidigena]